MNHTEQLLEDLFVNPPVHPDQAGFKGEMWLSRTTIRFKRGTCIPNPFLVPGLRSQLLWVTPENSHPLLFWSDNKGNLYHLRFHPYPFAQQVNVIKSLPNK